MIEWDGCVLRYNGRIFGFLDKDCSGLWVFHFVLLSDSYHMLGNQTEQSAKDETMEWMKSYFERIVRAF